MGIFRRRNDETLKEQLLREAEVDRTEADAPEPPAPVDPYAGTYPADVLGIWVRAMARPGEYDAVVTVEAAGIPGDAVAFATLASGDVIVDSERVDAEQGDAEQGDAELSPFADAVEQELQPPYRVVARRGEGDLWSVAARGIDVLELDFADGDEIELASIGGQIDVRVDGDAWIGRIPELEQAGEAAEGADYVVQAERLDGDLWEVRASPL
jgi:hypothetical protein